MGNRSSTHGMSSPGTQSVPLVQHLAPMQSHIVSALGFSLFINMLMIVPAIYMLQVYDRAVGSRSIETLAMLTLLLIVLLSSMGVLEWVRSQILIRAGAMFESLLAESVFNASFSQSVNGKQSAGQSLMDLAGLRQFISSNTPFAFFDFPWVPFYILIMFLFHPWFGMMAVFAALLMLGLAIINQKFTSARISESNNGAMSARTFALQNLANSEVIASMGMLNAVRNRWQDLNNAAVYQQNGASDTTAIFTSITKTLRIVFQSLALGLGAYLAINQQISPGMMIAGSILLGRALAPIDQLVSAWKQVLTAKEQFARLSQLIEGREPMYETLTLPDPKGRLTVQNVTAMAPNSKVRTLNAITLDIQAGACVGVIGPSASGKSTFARVLLGIWPTLAGTVRIDGSDIGQWDRSLLGPHIGYLPQDIELMAGSISENIARFGALDAAAIVTAAQAAGVHEMVLQLPNGYDTAIGHGGVNLSAGQRQRVALARALYGKPCLVVLDEPNSNLDEVGELALEAAIDKLKQAAVTTIIITHRPRILDRADNLLVLREGQLQDYGAAKLIMQKYRQTPPVIRKTQL